MRIISWNVNGLRALHKKGMFLSFVNKYKPDILCLQEIKTEEGQLPEEMKKIEKYYSYFSSSKNKKGYSGVAIYTKEKSLEIKYGMGIKKFDEEGRIIAAYFKDFVLLNVYFPNGGRGLERLAYKLEFYGAFLEYVEKLRKKGQSIVFCGDVNTAHKEIDLARPKANEKNTGFLPEERTWIDKVVAGGYVDVFRHFYPGKKEAYTYWDIKSRARERNVGWRLDYFFTDKNLIGKVKSAEILSEVYGSDHCPISIEL